MRVYFNVISFISISDESDSEGESLTEVSKKSSKNSLRGNVAMKVTLASMKFKSKKNTNVSKRKISKDSFKEKSKSSRRSFLEENIKSAGNAELHIRKRSILPTDDDVGNNPNVSKEPEETESSKAQSNTTDADEKQNNKNTLKMLYAKEKKDLEQAYNVLLEEYERRRDEQEKKKTKVMEKFGRASEKLKVELAMTRSWNEKDKEAIEIAKKITAGSRKDFSAECSNDSEISENKTKRYFRLDDADRI